MAYKVFFGNVLFPVAPSKITVKIANQNKTYNLINQGEINVPKLAGLTEVELELLLPNQKYKFAVYRNGFKKASYFLNKIENLKKNKKKFQFIVTRTLPRGSVPGTNLKVTIEDYSIKEDATNYGTDMLVSVKLKQYRAYGTKTVTIKDDNTSKTVSKTENREVDSTKTTAKTYTVKKGDCLWNIAKKLYGNGADYTKIYEANKDKIKNPNLIYPNQELTIP